MFRYIAWSVCDLCLPTVRMSLPFRLECSNAVDTQTFGMFPTFERYVDSCASNIDWKLENYQTTTTKCNTKKSTIKVAKKLKRKKKVHRLYKAGDTLCLVCAIHIKHIQSICNCACVWNVIVSSIIFHYLTVTTTIWN